MSGRFTYFQAALCVSKFCWVSFLGVMVGVSIDDGVTQRQPHSGNETQWFQSSHRVTKNTIPSISFIVCMYCFVIPVDDVLAYLFYQRSAEDGITGVKHTVAITTKYSKGGAKM